MNFRYRYTETDAASTKLAIVASQSLEMENVVSSPSFSFRLDASERAGMDIADRLDEAVVAKLNT